MKKLCILGGGSLNTPLLIYNLIRQKDSFIDKIYLYDIDRETLSIVGNYCKSLVGKSNLPTLIEFGVDLAEAVSGSTYILNQIRVGGIRSQIDDRRFLTISGIAGHAASYVEAIRSLPVIFSYLPIIEENVPGLIFINFSNPVSIICEAISQWSKVDCVGLCYHTTIMKNDFAKLLNVPSDEIIIHSFGINHFSWVLDVLVNGKSSFSELLTLIIEQRIKKYNYEFIKPLNIIPIGHAYSLYHRGGRFFVPEKGVKGNILDIIHKFIIPRQVLLRRLIKNRKRILNAYKNYDIRILDELNRKVPWYRSCIAPFLRDLNKNTGAKKYILTVKNKEYPAIKSATIETNCEVMADHITPVSMKKDIPDFLLYAVQNIVNSEKLMIKAIKEKSKMLALESMLIHPDIHSQKCIEKFLQFYFSL